MATFRTEYNTRLHTPAIIHTDRIITFGSCFSDSMGAKLKGNKFDTLINPFGTTYNPFSIHKLLEMAIDNQSPAVDTYLQHGTIFSNYDFHSSLSELNQHSLLENINGKIHTVHHFLKQCRFLFITYGTAWVYERNDNGTIVANCHKQPSVLFTKRLLSPEAVLQSFKQMVGKLQKFNPELQIILTLSPVRHIKDTLELNSVSKSILRLVCHSLIHTNLNVDYFPAYEIMMDDLRDYRFYSSDMIHPNATAEEYIWEKFIDRYFEKATKDIVSQWQSISKALLHKPFHPQSPDYHTFQQETLVRLKHLSSQLNLEEEILSLEKVLSDQSTTR